MNPGRFLNPFSRRGVLACVMISLLAVAPGGCGGGSAGTGGQVFDGSVVDSRSQPLSNVTVALPMLNLTSVTDASGQFAIETPPISGDIDFTLSRDGNSAATKVTDVPGDAERVSVIFEFEPAQKTARPIDVSVGRRPASSSSSSRPSSSTSSAVSSSSASTSSSSRPSSSSTSSLGSSSDDDDADDDDSSSSAGQSSSDDDDRSSSSRSSSSSSSDDDDDGGSHGGGSSSNSSSGSGSGHGGRG